MARAIHPVWLIDNHIEWKLVHQAKIPGKLDVAFNAREALFYLVRSQSIDVLDENGTLQKEIAIRGGYPAVEFPNHLLYDTLSNKLVSYYPKKGITSRFHLILKDGVMRYVTRKKPATTIMPEHSIRQTLPSISSVVMVSTNIATISTG